MRRDGRTLMIGVLAPAFALGVVACGGGSHDPTSRVVTSASTTQPPVTSPSSRAAHKASRVRPSRSTTATPTTRSHSATSSSPGTGSGGGIVVAAVPAGGAAPVAIPASPPAGTPRGGGASPTTVKPFDPTQNIDLSGTPGVTPAQQHAAEELIRDTLRDLAKYASQSAAYAAGYRTIGDGATGDEHWVNWSYSYDKDILDSAHPESLVYSTRTPGHPVLEAAMYSLPPGSRFSDIPPLFQSPLTQFHVHDNLCFAQTSDPLQKVFAGLTNASGKCPPGTTQEGNVPMIHVWIVKNPCGPFAALSGIAAGQVPPGETPNCDTAHAGVL